MKTPEKKLREWLAKKDERDRARRRVCRCFACGRVHDNGLYCPDCGSISECDEAPPYRRMKDDKNDKERNPDE